MRALLFVLPVLLLPAAPVAAQWEPPPAAASLVHGFRPPPAPGARQEAPSVDQGRIATAAFVGGAAGLLGGGMLGAMVASSDGDCIELCGLGHAVLGAALGEVLGMALGAHLGNDSRGSFGLTLLTSAGVAALGTTAVVAMDAGILILAVPMVQLVTTVEAQKATSF